MPVRKFNNLLMETVTAVSLSTAQLPPLNVPISCPKIGISSPDGFLLDSSLRQSPSGGLYRLFLPHLDIDLIRFHENVKEIL
jgi:hypothetical protein